MPTHLLQLLKYDARKVDQLQFAAFDEELANEDLVDFTPFVNLPSFLPSHLSQRVSLRRTLDLISVKLRMGKK